MNWSCLRLASWERIRPPQSDGFVQFRRQRYAGQITGIQLDQALSEFLQIQRLQFTLRLRRDDVAQRSRRLFWRLGWFFGVVHFRKG